MKAVDLTLGQGCADRWPYRYDSAAPEAFTSKGVK
jgi:hypothetical protein